MISEEAAITKMKRKMNPGRLCHFCVYCNSLVVVLVVELLFAVAVIMIMAAVVVVVWLEMWAY